MRNCLFKVLFSLLLWANELAADDIEAFLSAGEPGGTFVHVVMDLGDSDLDIELCTYGLTCGPPFMTAAAHEHLGDMYSHGESVTAPGVFKAVLAAVMDNALFDDLHFSLLISNHQGNRLSAADAGSGGGTILQGYRSLQQHRAEFTTTLKSIPVLNSGSSHVLQPKESYFEWLRYIQGGDVALGKNTDGNFGRPDPAPDYDEAIINNGKYVTPFAPEQVCARLYSILFSLGTPTYDDDLNGQIAAQLPLSSDAPFEQLLAYLHESSTDLLPDSDIDTSLQKTWVVTSRERSGHAADYAAAGRSPSVLYVNEPVELQANLTAALAEITSVEGSTMDAAFSADTFNAGRVLEDLFIPLFLPQAGNAWPGNVKKLKLKNSQGSSRSVVDQIVDVHGEPAFATGREKRGILRFDALTFWTDVTSLLPGDGRTIPQNADGGVVIRGGAGQKIDGFVNYDTGEGDSARYFIGDTNTDAPINGYPPRQLFYEPEVGQEFEPLDVSATTLQALKPLLDPSGELADDALLNLIRWARGQDTDNGKSSSRNWIMGEVLHSRPLAVNYGATPGYSKANPNVRVLFGSGDGIFHILQNTAKGGRESGRELFGFYPRALIPDIRQRHDASDTTAKRHYGVDGSPVALKVDRNGDGTLDHTVGDEVYAYVGLRRGGSSYFALDISNPDAVPSLLWTIDRTTGGAFDELGLTFSTPLVGKVDFSGTPVDVLVFAGGYDGGWNEGYTARRGKDLGTADDAVGNAIYIVNARTGELVWKAVRGVTGVSSNTHYAHAGLVDSIPSTVSALVTPTGIIDRLYVGDTGGAVWRVDLPVGEGDDENHRKDHWFISKLANLGVDAAEPGGDTSDDRRFFHAPDIVRSYDEFGDFDGLLIQSGNREDPNETEVENALFYLKDRHITSGSADVEAENKATNPAGRIHYDDLLDQTTCILGAEVAEAGPDGASCADRSLQLGWKLRYVMPGEKGLSTPLTDGGRVFATTFVPGDPASCSGQQGRGMLHVLQLTNATAVANQQRQYELGSGIPSPVESIGDVLYVPGGGLDLYDVDGDGVRDITQLLPSAAKKLYRTYWREPEVDPL